MNNFVRYQPKQVHNIILVANSMKGWRDFDKFQACYRELIPETQESICRMIGQLCLTCSNMGPLSGAELIWKICLKTETRNERFS